MAFVRPEKKVSALSFTDSKEEVKQEPLVFRDPYFGVERKKDPNEISYVLLITFYDNESDSSYWRLVTGRQTAFDLIVDFIEMIDFNNSYILAEETTLKDKKTISSFFKYMVENDLVQNPKGADIDDYIYTDPDVIEDEE